MLICSCSVTRHLGEGEYLLTRNVIKSDKQTPKRDRISSSELEKYLRQVPNRRILGMNIPIFIYSLADPKKDNGFNNFLRRIGEDPVIFDSLSVERSASNLKTYMNASGYLSSEVDYTISKRKKKAKVTYSTIQNKPYRIGTINYDYQDKLVQSMISHDSISSLLHTGDVFDTKVLDAERQRIAQHLKQNGYYDFSVNNISYLADSLGGNNTINITLIVKQQIVGYTDQGTPIYENSTISRINNIYLTPDYNPTTIVSQDISNVRLDTLAYRGLNIIYNKDLNVRKNVLRDLVTFYPNSIYNSDAVNKTYNNITRNNYFNSANILFRKDTSVVTSSLTYIGAGSEGANAATKESYLNCTILATPALRQNYKIELEASVASNFYALTATVGYQNRNIFKGMETFDFSVSGGYEFMRSEDATPSFEVGGSTSISFPRFIFPKIYNAENLLNMSTKVELSINQQQRPYYHRMLSNVAWGYSWTNSRYSSYTVRPIDVSLIKLSYIDQDFWDDLENPYLQNSYTSQLVAGISSSYVFNNQSKNINGNSILLRVNLETTGNLISGLSHLFFKKAAGEDYYNLFSIRFAQYARAEVSFSNKIVLGQKVNLVYRTLAGAGLSYGNSESIPYDRLFYCGGSNSMRGWVARTLGPGNETVTDSTYPNQLGNMKLEANLELRFPVWGILHGALFFDVGNIWFLKETDSTPEGVFKFDSFYKQLGFNTGLGARLDFDFFILRLDWGLKIHDPNLSSGYRWIDHFHFDNTSFNFGVGYPF
ncbi:MAG: BamA/TamA family outer membrane protein [Rikenellaceae bacterium]